MKSYNKLFLLTFTFVCCLSDQATSSSSKSYWYNQNYDLIKQKISNFNLKPEHLVRVRNVVFFVGDGMGLTTITASRTLKRQRSGNPEDKLAFDDFPATALVQTDIVDSQISESAAAGTALFSGVKTTFENLGVDETAGKDACSNVDSHAPSLFSWAQSQNLKTGFVTTTRITHATPAALYAHSRRYTEDDTKSDAGCKDIARQLIEDEPGRNINVLMGGGLRSFLPNFSPPGRRRDGRNLTDDWLNNHEDGEFVTDLFGMNSILPATEDVLGIFAPSHMHFNADRNSDDEPSLAEMTQQAIKVLARNNSNGFILVVEGGKIDLAHHYNNAFRALDDTLAFDEAVKVAVESLNLTESLVIVTADHASGIVFSGFATPKNHSILGLDKYLSNISKKPYQLLTYSSGMGYDNYNETLAGTEQRNAFHKATIPSTWANHAGDDVPLYATGPLANILFSGSFDQTYVPHAIAFAMCLFEYQERCQDLIEENKFPPHRIRKTNKIQLLREKLQSSLHNITEQQSNSTDGISNSGKVNVSFQFICSFVVLINFVS